MKSRKMNNSNDINKLLQEAVACHQSGKLEQAEQLYRKILGKQHNHFETLFLLGSLSSNIGKKDLAVTLLKEAILIRPDHAEAHNNLAIAFLSKRNLNAAVKSFKNAVIFNPEYVEAHFNLGIALQQSGKLDEAVKSFKSVVELKSDYAEAYFNIGVIYHERGEFDDALDCYEQAVAIKPDYAEALNNIGDVLQRKERFNEAIKSYTRAVYHKPDFAEAYYNLGIVCQKTGDFKKAESSYNDAVKYRPDYAEAYYNLGNLFNDKWKAVEAAENYRKAINLKPDFAEAHNNLGEALLMQRKPAEAILSFNKAFECKPDYIEARFHRSIAFLIMGDYKNGFAEYEHRLLIKKYNNREFSHTQWDGSSLAGKTILVHSEQGFGDTFQFVRFLPMVKACGGTVIFECQQGLSPLLKHCYGFDKIVERPPDAKTNETYDVHLPLMSSAKIFGVTAENIPADVPYIESDPELVKKWESEILAKTNKTMSEIQNPFKAGLVWSGKPDRKYNFVRSCPLSEFSPLGDIPNLVVFSLQKGDAVKQIENHGTGLSIINLDQTLDIIGKFVDTAAVIANLDIVISIDSAVAHLAAALGKPVWLILPYAHDWRWLMDREDSPWYPNVRLFRQHKEGDWKAVMRRVADELKAVVNKLIIENFVTL